VEAFLREVPLFAGCGSHVLGELARNAGSVFVPSGEYLFRQGEPAGWMAVVRTGRLEIRFETAEGEVLAGVAGRGTALGELALLTETPRSASVRAVRDSELIMIGAEDFARTFGREPDLAVAVARNLGQRLQASVDLAHHIAPVRVLALVALAADVPFARVADELATSLSTWGPVTRLAQPARSEASSELDYARLLEHIERKGGYTLLLVGDPSEIEWASFCRRSADRVIGLSRGGSRSAPAPAVPRFVGCDVAFVDAPSSAASMRNTLDLFRPRAHHLLRTASLAADVGRLARRLTGRAAGLVLSGGGARGLAHLGVIDRLLDAGVEIDAVGGCSMGAFVGSMLALGWDPARMLDTCRAELVERHPFNDYTVPREALIRARKARAMLSRVFGSASLEELARPTFVVSADLDTGELVVHTRGALAEAVGASMSIPGLAPPVAHGGRLLVDGGLLDNLPVDVMASRSEGRVIAVDVMRRLDAPRSRRRTRGFAPSIVETLTRATFLGSHERAASNRERADVVIAPAVADIELLQFDRIDHAVAAGRAAADAALEEGLDDLLRTAITR
jgi:predicted acylesterase/phospholipase RssA/CRP-like cAMP-binding protein